LNHHDIVFVDISLPDISGFDVIKAIRERQHDRKVPIVALTVYTGKEEKLACLNAGADEFANKPISLIRLKKLLTRYLLKTATRPTSKKA
jgi:CheY-like chemotaxis protein